MKGFAELLTSIAALVGAIAWPAAFVGVMLVFKSELRSALSKVPVMFDRVKRASLPGIAFELDQVASAEVESGKGKDGKITPRQIEAAARIESQKQDVGSDALLRELDRLCLEYDSIRRTLPSGTQRTQAMTRVVVKMRSLAPSLIDFLDAYKGSGSPGSRLAAITMMQMDPRIADVDWLGDRFPSEKPFVFYHAALALQNFANIATPEQKYHLRKVAEQALKVIHGFVGDPDKPTVEVLEMLISSLPQK